MKRTHRIFSFVIVLLAGVLVQAQSRSRGSISWTRTNGREEVRIVMPDGSREAPSTLFNGTVLATGNAANILSERSAPTPDGGGPIVPSAAPRVSQTLIYDDENSYLGTISLVSNGVYMTAAHVFDQLSESSLNSLLQRLNISQGSAELYQLFNGSLPLDVVVLIDKNAATRATAQAILVQLGQTPDMQSGDKFSLVHFTQMDNQIVEQQSDGTLSVSRDRNLLYLSNNHDARLTWGSSGALVFALKDGSANWSLSGVVQCVVKNEIASSLGGEDVSYFRAYSARILTTSNLQPVTISELKTRRSHYNLEACGPVDAKKGGGG